VLQKFENNHVFTDAEAWTLFRLAAFAEAFGWSLLISGILYERFFGSHTPVLIAGQIHGILFLAYATAAVGLYPNLAWSRRQAVVALLASVPPFGSLAIELWAGHQRQRAAFTAQLCILLVQNTD
jgi:integral membrane protein